MAILVWKRLCNIFVLHRDVRGSGQQVFAYFFPFRFSCIVYRFTGYAVGSGEGLTITFVVNLYLHGENLTLIILFYQILVC